MKLQQLIELLESEIIWDDITSLKVYESKKRKLLSIISADTDIRKIGVKQVNKYVCYLKSKNYKANTINANLSYLRTLLTVAYKKDLIDRVPHIPTYKIVSTKTKVLSELEEEQMIQWCINNHQQEVKQIIIIGVNTGVRIQNILDVSLEKIDNGYLRVWENKTDKAYSVPLNQKMKDLLDEFIPFTLNYQQAYYLFNKMKEELNLDERITPHTLRHTFCTRLIEKGISIPVIQKLANHKKINTTQQYLHFRDELLEQAVDML